MTVKKPVKVLITAPSLDEKQNVSGISTVARQIIERGSFEYRHFEAGRRDGERADAKWIWKQIASVRRFRREIRGFDIVHLNTNFNPLAIVRDSVYAAAARFAKIPILIHVHGGRYLAEEFKSGRLKKIAEKMLSAGDAVVVLSEPEKKIVERRWRNLSVRVLENAVETDEAIDGDGERENAEKILIFLGRLHESKGLDEIAEACRRLKNENFRFRFRCFGAGERRDFFVAEMTKILGEKFYYGGVVSGAEKWKELARADVFLLPSRYGEGLPVAMLEAMAAGCVVIVSEMASTGAVVRDGANGFLVAPRDVNQLTEKLRLLLSGKIDSETLRKNARATIRAKFNLNDYIKRLENIYVEILGAGRK